MLNKKKRKKKVEESENQHKKCLLYVIKKYNKHFLKLSRLLHI